MERYFFQDKSKENGQPRRCLDVSILENELNFKCDTNFESGLRETYEFYKILILKGNEF